MAAAPQMEMQGMPNQMQMPAANEFDYEPYTPMQDQSFDFTDPCESLMKCPCFGWETRTLVAQDQEVFLVTRNWCGGSKQRRPYAQLGAVDKHSTALGCSALVSDFAPLDEEGAGGLKPGCCGTNGAIVDAAVAELQNRKRIRGGVGQVRKLDYIIDKAVKIATQAPLLAHHLGVQTPQTPLPTGDKVILPPKTLDVSNYIEKLCCTTRTLDLEPEEAVLSVSCCLGLQKLNSKREYGSLGYVEKRNMCFCCSMIGSDLSPIPGQGNFVVGCPCANRSQTAAIVRELRDRMAIRGQTGQLRKQEKILNLIADIDQTMLALKDKAGLEFPPSQEEMQRRFGDAPPVLGVPVEREPPLPTKSYDTTNKIESCLQCICTLGLAGFTKEEVQLDQDYVHTNTKNNIDDTNVRTPYGEMDSVTVAKQCCCCWSVNDREPGFGCSGDLVKELALDLQERKVKRGNIHHLKQLRKMQATSAGAEVMADLLIKKENIQFPPSPETIQAVWGGSVPRGLTVNTQGHIEPDKEFQTKTYDVTNKFLACSSFVRCMGCHSTTLELDGDELTIVQKNWCNEIISTTPYGNLGSVETEQQCCCCVMIPEIAAPGFGCSTELVEEIAAELQERKVKRGNIAQMKQQENIILDVLSLDVKMDLLMNKYGVQYPPSPAVMSAVFAPAATAPESTATAAQAGSPAQPLIQ